MITKWQEIGVKFFIEEILDRYWNGGSDNPLHDKVLEIQGKPIIMPDGKYRFMYRIFMSPLILPAGEYGKEVVKSGNYVFGTTMTFLDEIDNMGLKFSPIVKRKAVYNLFLNVFLGYNLELPKEISKCYNINSWYKIDENGKRYFWGNPKETPETERLMRIRIMDYDDYKKITDYIETHKKLPQELVKDDLVIEE